MQIKDHVKYLDELLKDLSGLEKKGLDTSSLKLFIKNLKMFEKIQNIDNKKEDLKLSLDDKLLIIKSFLEDTKVFPRIIDVINYANTELDLDFKDQKESRDTTIKRVIGRIKQKPELKEKVKVSAQKIRNEKMHSSRTSNSKKEIDKTASFMKWAEILREL